MTGIFFVLGEAGEMALKYRNIALSRFTNSAVTSDASNMISSYIKENVKHPLELVEVLRKPRCKGMDLFQELYVTKRVPWALL